jgi:hypothetical protein
MTINSAGSKVNSLTIDGQEVKEVTIDGSLVFPFNEDMHITDIDVYAGTAGSDDTDVHVTVKNRGNVPGDSNVEVERQDTYEDDYGYFNLSVGSQNTFHADFNHDVRDFGSHEVEITHNGGTIYTGSNPESRYYNVGRFPGPYLVSNITDNGSTYDVTYKNLGADTANVDTFHLGAATASGTSVGTGNTVTKTFTDDEVESFSGSTATAYWTASSGSIEGERDTVEVPQTVDIRVTDVSITGGFADGEGNTTFVASVENFGNSTGDADTTFRIPDSSGINDVSSRLQQPLNPGETDSHVYNVAHDQGEYGDFYVELENLNGDITAGNGNNPQDFPYTVVPPSAYLVSDITDNGDTFSVTYTNEGSEDADVQTFHLGPATSDAGDVYTRIAPGSSTTATFDALEVSKSTGDTVQAYWTGYNMTINGDRDSITPPDGPNLQLQGFSYNDEYITGGQMWAKFKLENTGDLPGDHTFTFDVSASSKNYRDETLTVPANSIATSNKFYFREMTPSDYGKSFDFEFQNRPNGLPYGGTWEPESPFGHYFHIENVSTTGGTEETDSTIDVSLRNIGRDAGTGTVTVSDPDHANGASTSQDITLNSGERATADLSINHPNDGTVNVGTHNISVSTGRDSTNSSYTVKESTKFEITSFSATGGMATAVDNNHRTTVTNTGGVAGEVSISYDNPKVNGYTTTLSAGSHVNFNKLDGRGWTSDTGGTKSLTVSTPDDSATASYTVEPVPADITMEILETDNYPLGIKAEIENVGGQTVDMEVRNQSDNDHRFEDTNNDRVMTMPPGQIRTITLPHHDCVYYNRIRVYFVNSTGEYANGASRGVYVRSQG